MMSKVGTRRPSISGKPAPPSDGKAVKRPNSPRDSQAKTALPTVLSSAAPSSNVIIETLPVDKCRPGSGKSDRSARPSSSRSGKENGQLASSRSDTAGEALPPIDGKRRPSLVSQGSGKALNGADPTKIAPLERAASTPSLAGADARRRGKVNKASVSVSIRIRPHIEAIDGPPQSSEKPDRIRVDDSKTNVICDNKAFGFDRVFGSSVDQDELYNENFKNSVLAAMDGFNVTVFAYGQTSSGKTHTMMGSDAKPGIIPQSVRTVFDYISKSTQRQFVLQVSYMEIYNEVVVDLLNDRSQVLIQADKKRGIGIKDLTQHVVRSPQEVAEILTKGNAVKKVAENYKHSNSSRSHTIFRMEIESAMQDFKAVSVSTLMLIDLAGSEAAHLSDKAHVRQEGANINKSLHFLKETIKSLVEGKQCSFRNSKLTRLLEPSLLGNAIVSLVCNINTVEKHMKESLSTLEFGALAKKIHLDPKKHVETDDTLLHKYQQEIMELCAAKEETDMELDEVRSELESRIKAFEGMMLSAESLKERLSNAEKESERRKQELEQKHQEKEALEKLLREEEEKRAKFEAEYESSKAANESSEKEKKALQSKLEESRKNNEALYKRQAEAEANRKAAEAEKEKQTKVLEELKAEKEALEKKIQENQLRTSTVVKETKEVDGEIDGLKDHVDKLSNEVNDLNLLGEAIHAIQMEEHQANERRIIELTESFEREKSELLRQIQERDDTISSLYAALQ